MSDIDAENVFSCITESINKCGDEIYKRRMKSFYSNADAEKIKSEIEWFKLRSKYLLNLTKKMKHVKINK